MWIWRLLFALSLVGLMAVGLTAWAVIYFWRYLVPLGVLYVVFRVWRHRRQRATVERQPY